MKAVETSYGRKGLEGTRPGWAETPAYFALGKTAGDVRHLIA
jgi:hypothetical protein